MSIMDIGGMVYDLFKCSSLDVKNVMGLPMSLVYEFLASFALTRGERMWDENSAWKFCIQTTNFRWTRKEATENLGFPLFGIPAHAMLEQGFSLRKRLIGLDHFGSYSSPYSFKCEAWNYIHRLIATNIIQNLFRWKI